MHLHASTVTVLPRTDGSAPVYSCKLGYSLGKVSALWMCGQKANLMWLTCQVCPKPAVILSLSIASAAVLRQVLTGGEAHRAGATNCPFSDSRPEAFSQHIEWIQQQQQRGLTLGEVSQMSTDNEHAPKSRLCVICRRGNDSQRVVKLLQCNGVNGIVDLVGGLEAWCREPGVDFPGY